MKLFFRIHNNSENIKGKVATYSLKGKVDIWCKDLKNVNGINEEGLTCNEFERLFRINVYLAVIIDSKAK